MRTVRHLPSSTCQKKMDTQHMSPVCALTQDVVDLVRETMCDTVLAELNAAPVDARSRSRGGKQVWPPQKALSAHDESHGAS